MVKFDVFYFSKTRYKHCQQMEHQKSSEICPDSIPKLWIDPQIHRLMW